MKDEEVFEGFYRWANGKGEESYFIGRCPDPEDCDTEAEKLVLKSIKKVPVENRDKPYWDNFEKKTQEIYSPIADCIDKKLSPTSDEVQQLIEKHHAFSEQFHNATKKVYKALAQLYRKHPSYRKQLDFFHPQLAEFMAEAMEVFAEHKLS